MRLALTLCFSLSLPLCAYSQSSPAPGSVLLSPCEFHGAISGQQGLIVVPENHSAPDSRVIAVHFLRFPAAKPSSLPPVFFLPGGPGGYVDEASVAAWARIPKGRYSTLLEIRHYNEHRDVFIVNHRGNADGPGLQSESLHWFIGAGRLDTARTIEAVSRRAAVGAKQAFDRWQARGMDLAGYDIINMVEDIDDIRTAFGFDKIILRGGSFGSQWSFAYMKQHPQRVDRALLTAIEPLDHGYDSPQGIWNVFERLERQVVAERSLKLPPEGLLGAVKKIVGRLEAGPVMVDGRHPQRAVTARIPIGVDDFRQYLLSGLKGRPRMDRRTREVWPKFVIEIYHEDYQYLASQIMAYRDDPDRRTMIATLVDNSLGISAAREHRLRAEPAYRWLGEVNWSQIATRHVTPTTVVSEEFRAFTKSDVPVLMVHGDLDLSTPIENALAAIEYLPNGHLIRVEGGTHAAIREIVAEDADFMKRVYAFMDADFERVEPQSVFKDLPTTVQLSPLRFETLAGPTLFEQVNQRR